MQQKKRHSLLESLLNVVIGFGVGLISQIIIFPFFDIHIPLQSNIKITLWFTAISIVRSYILRRVFTTRGVKRNEPDRTSIRSILEQYQTWRKDLRCS